MLKLVKRPKTRHWIVRGTTLSGVRFEKSTGVENEKVAEEIRIRWENDLLTSHVRGPQEVVTFEQAAIDYEDHGDGEAVFLQPLKDHFGHMRLRDIGQHEIDVAAKKLLPKAAPATRNRKVYTPVSAVLRHAARKKWCDSFDLIRPKIPKREDRWLTPDEAERLLNACAKHMRPLVEFLLFTGARAGEALYLDWRDVDLTRAQVTFVKTKNGEPRSVPLRSRVVASLSALKHREGAVFRTHSGEPYSRPRAEKPRKGHERDAADTSAGSKITTGFKAACRRANIENFRVHDCRHTWASWVAQRGGTLADLQRLGGWKTASMVFRYSHADVSSHAAAIERLPGGN